MIRCNVEVFGRDVIGRDVELLSQRRGAGQLTRLRLLLRIDFRRVRVRRLRIVRLRARLLLHPLLLLLLLLLHYRGPVQPDTTRATGQSTEGRGDLLLRLLLQISSASIPGELLMLLLLMRRMLLLLMSLFAGRLRIE
jgi:hypothetical protein